MQKVLTIAVVVLIGAGIAAGVYAVNEFNRLQADVNVMAAEMVNLKDSLEDVTALANSNAVLISALQKKVANLEDDDDD